MENKDQDTYKISWFRVCKMLLSKCRFWENVLENLHPSCKLVLYGGFSAMALV